MIRFLAQLGYDVRVWLWGIVTGHPNVRETKIGIILPIELRHEPALYGVSFRIWFCWPQMHVLNAYELETDYLQRGQQAHG